MTQKISPFIEAKYGWDFGESGWNSGMDENLLKFSFFADGCVDAIVSDLPALINGKAYFNTSNNRFYFTVNSTWVSSPTPKWCKFRIRETGQIWEFDGSSLQSLPGNQELSAEINSLSEDIQALGSAAYRDENHFTTKVESDLLESNITTYIDSLVTPLQVFRDDLVNYSTSNKGAGLVGYDSSLEYPPYSVGSTLKSLSQGDGSSVSSLIADLDQPPTGGSFYTTSSTLNKPQGMSGYVFIEYKDANNWSQELKDVSSGRIVWRVKSGGAIGGWYELTIGSLRGQLPDVSDENYISNSEASSLTGWTITSGSPTVSGSVITLPAGNTRSNLYYPATAPASGDFLIYVRFKVEMTTSRFGYLELLNSSGVRLAQLNYGYNWSTSSPQVGAISVYTPSNGNVLLETGTNYSDFVEYIIHFDSNQSVTNFFRRDGSTINLKGTLPLISNYRNISRLGFSHGDIGVNGEVGIDYVSMAKPNFVAIGDSICAGSTKFNPDPAYYTGVDNYQSTWMAHFTAYSHLRNRFVVNKGIGSQTSAQIQSRIAEATGHGAKVVFLHASTNDERNNITQATRTANIQSSVDSINSSGAKCVLLNAIAPNSSNQYYPQLGQYVRTWWNSYRSSLVGVESSIDILQAVADAEGNISTSNADPDGLHPNIQGYSLIGAKISSYK